MDQEKYIEEEKGLDVQMDGLSPMPRGLLN
jgi:hypothetical protein